MKVGRAAALLAGLLTLACSTEPPPACEAFDGITHALGATDHTATCSDPGCGNGLNPPTAGAHCGTTLSCRVFAEAQPRCSWLHNVEHGHLVLAYHCPDGCDAERAELEAFHAAAPSPKRVILTPDPGLATRFAAVVWGTSWASDTLDLDAVRCVQGLQDQAAPEPFLGCSP